MNNEILYDLTRAETLPTVFGVLLILGIGSLLMIRYIIWYTGVSRRSHTLAGIGDILPSDTKRHGLHRRSGARRIYINEFNFLNRETRELFDDSTRASKTNINPEIKL